MESERFEFVTGKRFDAKLVYLIDEKQLYKKKSQYKAKTFYTCYDKNCKARVEILHNGICKKSSKNGEHSEHPNQEQAYAELKSLENIKTQCKKSATLLSNTSALANTRQVFRSECESNVEGTQNLVFSRVKRTLERLSAPIFLKSPKTPLEVIEAFQTEYICTNYGLSRNKDQPRPFYKACISEPEFAYCIFASEIIMQGINENITAGQRRYLIDGTFKVVPMGCFKQLLVIYIQHLEEQIFPLLFILTTKKSSYKHMLNYINDSIFKFEAQSFTLDYEMALRKSLRTCFPEVVLKGCWFHYCQAIRRNIMIRFKSLMPLIRDNKTLRLCYHKLLALPLLPADAILNVFEKTESEIKSCVGNKSFDTFFEYFKKQWLEKIGPVNICVYKEALRTTSSIEAYNGALGRLIHPNGNFFKFVLAINKEEFEKSRNFTLLTESGGSFGGTKKRKTSRDKDAKIANAIDDLEKGKITITAYMHRLIFPKNYICTDMEPIEDIFEEPPAYESEDESSDDGGDAINTNSDESPALCVICHDVPPNILALPCRHLKMCNACCMLLQAQALADNDSNTKCPYCREIICDTILVYI